MARLALSIGGMVLVDQQLFGSEQETRTVTGPRLQDLRVQSSGYGGVIPRVYGKARLSGNVIWMRGFHEETRTETQTVGGGSGGGKGGGGGGQTVTTVTYVYFVDLAVALCEGPITSIRRLLPQRLQGDFRLQRRINLASRLLHRPLRLTRQSRPRSNQATGPKTGVHFNMPRGRRRVPRSKSVFLVMLFVLFRPVASALLIIESLSSTDLAVRYGAVGTRRRESVEWDD